LKNPGLVEVDCLEYSGKMGVIGDSGPFVAWESYESDRRRAGVLGDDALLIPETLVFDRAVSI